MKIQRNIIILFIVAVIVIARFAFHSYQNYKTNLQTSLWVNQSNNVIKNIADLYAKTTSIESEYEDYVITGQKSFAASFQKDSLLIKNQLKNLRELTADNLAEKNNVDTLSSLLNEKITYSIKGMTLRDSSVLLATQQLSGEYGVSLMTQIKSVMDSMLNGQNRLLKSRNPANNKAQKRELYIAFLGAAFCLVFLIFFLFLINRDIQLRKRAESELKSSEIKYRKLIEDARVVMFTTNVEGYFTFISNRVLMLTGYQKEGLIGKLFPVLVAPAWVEKIRTFYQEQFKNKESQTVLEFPILTKNGEE
ncbi:MAG: CHASE3 domain-containing protein [Chitinophagaceae bacterium]